MPKNTSPTRARPHAGIGLFGLCLVTSKVETAAVHMNNRKRQQGRQTEELGAEGAAGENRVALD